MRSNTRDAGFSLAESMIAVTLTLIVVSAAVETMSRSIALANTSRLVSSTNHGLQAAMSLMVRDLIQTGQGVPLGGIPIPNGTGAEPVRRPGPGAMTFAAGTDMLPSLTPGNGLGPRLLGVDTDVVSVLYVDRTLNLAQQTLSAIASNGSTMTVNAATPVTGVNGLRAGDLILFSNALGTALQMVTQTPTTQVIQFAAGDPMRLNQRGANQGSIMELRGTNGVFPPTTAMRVLLVSYYVDTETDASLPRLVRRINMGERLAIAMGVENLQITYDLVDGMTNPANVDTPGAGNGANQIRKANLFLSARSLDINPQTRQYYRNSMATQVGLRSLSFVDRYR